MSYRHGIYIQEKATTLVPTRKVYSRLPVVVGTAPVQQIEAAAERPVNEPKLCFTQAEFTAAFGSSANFAGYTLCEAAEIFFNLYNVGPVVFVNVLDPGTHKQSVEAGDKTFAGGALTLDHAYPMNLVVQDSTQETTYVLDTDYSLNRASGLVTRISTGSIAEDEAVKVSYDYADPSAVSGTDIIGGVDGTTGAATGLELVNQVFPRFRKVPGQILAPGWTHDPAVGIYLAAKAGNVSGHFRAAALVDAPVSGTDAPEGYTEVPAWKNDNNYTDEDLIVCWPKVKVGGIVHHLSTHVAALSLQVDAENGDIPFVSPSNQLLSISGLDFNGSGLYLSPDQGNYLNSEGIVTAINFDGGWKCWGNRTGIYPSSTDVKDAFIPIRAMFNWLHNTLVLTWWQKVDYPLIRRQINSIVDSVNVWLNGLVGQEVILGGKCSFLEEENPATDLMDGIARFHIWWTPPSPARELEFITEYDPDNLATLFD